MSYVSSFASIRSARKGLTSIVTGFTPRNWQVSEVVPDHAALMARADALARAIAGNAPLTLRATKEAVRRLRGRHEDDADRDLILLCYLSEDFREGMEAFLGKRAPVWRGV